MRCVDVGLARFSASAADGADVMEEGGSALGGWNARWRLDGVLVSW